MTKNGIEAASELTGDAYAWAEKRMHSVDQNVARRSGRAQFTSEQEERSLSRSAKNVSIWPIS